MSPVRKYFSTKRASQVMQTPVITLCVNDDVDAALEVLHQHKISGAPVVSSEGTCVGVFSQKDAARTTQSSERNAVVACMTSPAITVSEHHSLLDVSAIMYSSHIHRVPVVDNLGRVVGIISTMDIVNEIIPAMAAEECQSKP
ncbi:MAG: CBS domain-containing protein [Planctomycetales bacterium]|nr:CBS domain-containing protein [Planctomycetales bacterium]